MKLKILKNTKDYKDQILEVSTEKTKIIICFGEDYGADECFNQDNPNISGLTIDSPSYDGVFILRNPENCSLTKHILKEIPIYLEKKAKFMYDTCADFRKFEKMSNIKEVTSLIKINEFEITYFLIDPSNVNTIMLLIKNEKDKVLISGDFRNYDLNWKNNSLEKVLSTIGQVNYWFIEGRYFGKETAENIPINSLFMKLKNIMKFYKQVFIIQSETDLMINKLFYNVSLKTKRIFIENVFLANLSTTLNGSAPNPVTNKKVYTYIPLKIDNENSDFKKKYVTPFYINNVNDVKMKKEKFLLNIDENMLQDIQLFLKKEILYDGCLIFAKNKRLIKTPEMDEFIQTMKDIGLDYYELYTTGQVNYKLLNKISIRLKAKKVIPINYNPSNTQIGNVNNLQIQSKN